MSIWQIVDDLVLLHDRAGKLRDLYDAWQAVNRARGFDVNDEDSWDAYLLGDSMIRDMRNRLRRHRDRTMQLRELAAIMPGSSGQATRLFLRWADAHRDRGAESREAQAAQTALARYLYDWADGVTDAMGNVHDAGQVLRAQLTFYQRFRRLADAFIRFDTLISGTAQDPQASQAFHEGKNWLKIRDYLGTICYNYRRGLRQRDTAKDEFASSQREWRSWHAWLQNRSRVERSLGRRTAPTR